MQNNGIYARNADGTFAEGNPGGPGRKPRVVEQEYRLALAEVVPVDRWRRIAERAATDAENGDRYAREWLSEYLLGKPREIPDSDAAPEPTEPPKVVLLDWRRKTSIINGEDHHAEN